MLLVHFIVSIGDHKSNNKLAVKSMDYLLDGCEKKLTLGYNSGVRGISYVNI